MNTNTIIIIVIFAIIILFPSLKRILKNVKIEGSNSIHIACLYGDIRKIKEFLNSGVNINSKDFSNRTPLMYAAEDGATEILDYLLKNGANINEIDIRGESALIIALKNHNINAAKFLIESGADLSIINEEDKNALNIAQDIDSTEIIELINNKINS
ncbi:ankyrin repeat domain-containing protein [Brachyspira catarrhinii]|uniref:Ankyrin repeat domain-containing protein n=1 Tax=Brachyspira catarrhinii TaxID=2528966 RepID=A0ABY2TPY2_9SPIR|nr:ankyrin repeat domain-containing protein [Brachyspira catarrhinii]TKZ33906.1 ankyrin repeat domain-containing protein [Brachyspira catarrhinii]